MILVKDHEMTGDASNKRFHGEELTDQGRNASRSPIVRNSQHEYSRSCFRGIVAHIGEIQIARHKHSSISMRPNRDFFIG